MAMGKGFPIDSKFDLVKHLRIGYENSRQADMPGIEIVAICNDTSATLVSFAYQMKVIPRRKAAMALIVGTGCNATIPIALNKLHPTKRPAQIQVLDDSELVPDLKITVNTEWTINGTVGPLHELGYVTHWDKILDTETDVPGFQPFEYMTAGRYLGELGRIIALDYFTNHLNIPKASLPQKIQEQYGLNTTFLGNMDRHLSPQQPSILKQLNSELPPNHSSDAWQWTLEGADVLYGIAKAIQVRAAGMVAAATIGLLACAGEIHLSPEPSADLVDGEVPGPAKWEQDVDELMVGYTGGCIVHFQDYLEDCQAFLDAVMGREFGGASAPRVVLEPCHDGGITGAGILAGTVQSIRHDDSR
jgi:hexokinase